MNSYVSMLLLILLLLLCSKLSSGRIRGPYVSMIRVKLFPVGLNNAVGLSNDAR